MLACIWVCIPQQDLHAESGLLQKDQYTHFNGLHIRRLSRESLFTHGTVLYTTHGRTSAHHPTLVSAVTTGTLAAYMGKGYYDKRKVFPQGVLAVMSTLISIAYWGSIKNL